MLTKQRFSVTGTAFISGMVLMGFEIFGTRIISPFFGSGMHTWGAIISVVMGGVCAGYAYGGRIADKRPPADSVKKLLLAAGILLIVFPLYGSFFCKLVDSFAWGRKISTLVVSVPLFLPATFLLGMISPLLVKLYVTDLDSVGQGAGNIYSITTAGSIAGTLLTAFLLVGTVPSSNAIPLFGVLLIANYATLKLLGSPGQA